MREALFIKRNKDKWENYQHTPVESPDELAERFTTLVDDVAYAKTFYPKSKVTTWLNGLASNTYLGIYAFKNKGFLQFLLGIVQFILIVLLLPVNVLVRFLLLILKLIKAEKKTIGFFNNLKDKLNKGFINYNLKGLYGIKQFFGKELPLLMYQYRYVFIFSILFFVLTVALGSFFTFKDEAFATEVLGEDYIAKTKEYIANNEPFKIYSTSISGTGIKFLDFVYLSLHNVKIDLLAYLGLLFFMNIKIMISNGLMVGTFFTFFHKNNLGSEAIAIVGLHGVIELTMITISVACSFIMIKGLLIPGTESRAKSFIKDLKNSAKIMLAVIPLTFLAGFIETYLTYNGSKLVNEKSSAIYLVWAFFVLSAIFVIFYFFIYPFILHKRGYRLQDSLIKKLKLDENAEEKSGQIKLIKN